MVRVLGFGDNVVDKYEHTKIMYPGGNCVNFAVYAHQCGAKSAYMGYFGTDKEAEHVISTLKNIGIEMYKCKQIEGENGCARATIKDGDRVFLGSNEGGVRGINRYILDMFDIEYIKTFDLVHSGNYSFTESELHKIKEAGVPVSFDFSDDSTPQYISDVAPNVDFAFMSCGDMDENSVKERIETTISYGCKLVVATRGSKGSIAYNGKEFFYQPAFHVDAVDTMGAGDSLITSFMVGYIGRKKQGDITESKIIKESLSDAAKFAANSCLADGSFGYGKKY